MNFPWQPVLLDALSRLRELILKLYALVPEFSHKRELMSVLVLFLMLTVAFVGVRLLWKVCGAFFGLFIQDYNLRGEKLFAKGKYEKAQRCFERAKNYLKVAQCYLKLSAYLEAAKYFEIAKDYDAAGKYYAQEGEYLKAAKIFEASGRSIDAAEKYELAGEFMAAGDLYRRLHYLKKAEEMYGRVNAARKTADMYLEEYKFEKKKPIDKVDHKSQEKRQTYLRELAKKSGEYAVRAENFGQAAEAFLDGGHIQQAAEALRLHGKFQEAARLFMQSNMRAEAAVCFEQAGSYEEALVHYRTLGEHEAVARVLEATGRAKEANEVRAMLNLKRGQKLEAAARYVQAGKIQEAAELFKEAKAFDQAAQLYVEHKNYAAAGDTYVLAGKFAEAADCFVKASRFTTAANCYLKLGNEGEYVNMLLQGGSYLEAGLFLEEKDEERAITILQKIEAQSPDYRFACNALGRIFQKKNMDSLAAEKLERSVKDLAIDKGNLDFFYDLAVFRQKLGQHREALKLYDGILSADYHFKDAVRRHKDVEAAITAANVSSGGMPQRGMRASPGLLAADKQPGAMGEQLVNQRYAIRREIGRGGMGLVCEAWDGTLQRKVALKFLPSSLSPDEKNVEKFLNEARSAARLNHPNIVTIHDIDMDQSNGNYFIVMEFIDGANLKEIIEASQNLPFASINLIGAQICDALSFAHQKNVIHRDVKTANILWTNEKLVKVTDFGLAKIVEEAMISTTKAQGTPVYMAPEQVLGHVVDARSDIYSFGVSLYEMLTGKVPFDKGDIGFHHLNTPPLPPQELRHDTPAHLSAIIMKCLAKKPEERFQNVAEIRKQFV